MSTVSSVSYQTIAERAKSLLPDVLRIAGLAGYRPAGVPHSEILFMLSCLAGTENTRIIETGRGRGQSTLMLSHALEQRSIISIEHSRDSPNEAEAKQRLAKRSNVVLLYGDARKLLPQLVEPGDVVLIDGPKAFRAIRLALRLLASGKVQHVFVHDVTTETPERRFVARHFPEARFSDWTGFADVAIEADAGTDAIPPSRRNEAGATFGYGYAMTYLPRVASRNYRWLLARAFLAGLNS